MTKFRSRLAGVVSFLALSMMTAPAYAAGSNMPWEAPLQKILESIQGPVAKIIARSASAPERERRRGSGAPTTGAP